jgi:hypothetical protein
MHSDRAWFDSGDFGDSGGVLNGAAEDGRCFREYPHSARPGRPQRRTASQDRDKGVVTLSGHVGADGDKAEAIARSFKGAIRSPEYRIDILLCQD